LTLLRSGTIHNEIKRNSITYLVRYKTWLMQPIEATIIRQHRLKNMFMGTVAELEPEKSPAARFFRIAEDREIEQVTYQRHFSHHILNYEQLMSGKCSEVYYEHTMGESR
jgi:hypothetical protein